MASSEEIDPTIKSTGFNTCVVLDSVTLSVNLIETKQLDLGSYSLITITGEPSIVNKEISLLLFSKVYSQVSGYKIGALVWET